jgi:phosphate transport system protein
LRRQKITSPGVSAEFIWTCIGSDYKNLSTFRVKKKIMPTQENYLHLQLDDLRSSVLVMAAKTQEALENAGIALLYRDRDRACAVISGDNLIDEMENEIDRASLNILARSQPVAKDLRFVVTALRMVLDLERISDESALIAKQSLFLQELPLPYMMGEFERFSNHAREIMRNAVQSFREHDSDMALKVIQEDAGTTKLNIETLHPVVNNLTSSNPDPWGSIYAILIMRAYDRICRRAQNIAEHTYFMVEGVSIKHRFANKKNNA